MPGGFRVSGRWSYGSFIQHSKWTVGNSVVYDGETARRDGNGTPDIRSMIFPTEAVEIIDVWHVSGLRGTGSNDFQVSDLFVPEDRSLSAFAPTPLQPGALYTTPMITIFAATLPCMSGNKTLMDKRLEISIPVTKPTVSMIIMRCRCERLLIEVVMNWFSSRSQASRLAGVAFPR